MQSIPTYYLVFAARQDDRCQVQARGHPEQAEGSPTDPGPGQHQDRERGGVQGRHREDTGLQNQARAGE